MNKVVVFGVAPSEIGDDRLKILVKVDYNNEAFDWVLRMPQTFSGSFQDYADQQANAVFADIESKIQQWENLNPKTKEIDAGFLPFGGDGQKITVPVLRDEIVQPTYPDYYAARASEYPKIEEQLDAFWKGGNAKTQMEDKIAAIKAKYPKP